MTWEFFPTLRVAPMLGRAFAPDDEIEGRHRVAILSHGFWQRRFGGAADVLGKTLVLVAAGGGDNESWEVVGVMLRGFTYPIASDRPAEIFAPVTFRKC